MTEPSDGSVLDATLESERFEHIGIALHWITALLIIVMFATAWSREAVDHDTHLASALMTVHRTTGVVTWMVEWVRLVWRYYFACLPPFSECMPKLFWCSRHRVSAMSCFAGALFIVHSGNAGGNPTIRSVFVQAHE